MRSRKITLEESIVQLASETGASQSFVDKVRALFLGRGIDLEDSSEPYAAALNEAFQRHAIIRERLDEVMSTAMDLATQAQADAKLAQSKANSAKAQTAADALQDDIRVLREELNRANAPKPQ